MAQNSAAGFSPVARHRYLRFLKFRAHPICIQPSLRQAVMKKIHTEIAERFVFVHHHKPSGIGENSKPRCFDIQSLTDFEEANYIFRGKSRFPTATFPDIWSAPAQELHECRFRFPSLR